ncbi:hypothetical protein P7K49_032999 [Saguinus oedipus]|uniref:Uncharacterized protein n=1 Tax=Saguinus oedipus TaxID=9490 RepID=A0ABQ9TQN6_SAGOE|nr:hypothetical protein P7K49_032999 [Saguinus oedipus]
MAAPGCGEGGARRVTWPRRRLRGLQRTPHVSLAAPRLPAPALRTLVQHGGAQRRAERRAVALRPAEAVSEPTTVAFDVRPGGVVHSFSQNVGPGVPQAGTGRGRGALRAVGTEEGARTLLGSEAEWRTPDHKAGVITGAGVNQGAGPWGVVTCHLLRRWEGGRVSALLGMKEGGSASSFHCTKFPLT